MDYKKIALGLGWFSIALGVIELVAAKRIADRLKTPGGKGLVQAFGAREIVAGVGLLQAPAHSARTWNRVAGDALDLGALAVAARRDSGNRAVWGAIAFVLGATALDIFTARGLDRTTGKLIPFRA